ncbi:MAG: hypothetical protein Q9208_004029 [Pyrenodesmia sp. 3 TL-2023]
MPRLEDAQELLPSNFKQRTQSAWDSFSDFALRDNVLEVAVGLILASAFTTVVSAFVDGIILPPISLLPFFNRNLEEKFAVLRPGPRYGDEGPRGGYNTLKMAMEDGAVVMAYGDFLSKFIRLLVVALALFVIARVYGWVADDNVIKRQVKCKYCRKSISEKGLKALGLGGGMVDGLSLVEELFGEEEMPWSKEGAGVNILSTRYTLNPLQFRREVDLSPSSFKTPALIDSTLIEDEDLLS